MASAKAKIFRNVIYSSVAKGTTFTCVVVTNLVLAWNLSPSDYGVVAFTGMILGFLGHFSDLGVGSAAIRCPSLDENSLQTAFTLKLILGIGAFAAVYLVAPFAHHFFEHPATDDIMRVLAFYFLVNSIGFMPWVTLTREQNFRSLLVPGVVNTVVRAIIAIPLVLSGWTYWAVVFAEIGAAAVSNVVVHFMKKIPVGFHFDRHTAGEYLRFGAPLVGSGVVVFLIFNLDRFLIGSGMGSVQLGYYAVAFTCATFICGLLSDTVHTVLFPAFSSIQHDMAAMRRWYLKTVDLVAFLSLIINTTLLANAPYVLVTILGNGSEKWLPATLSLQILCLYGIVRATTEPLANVFMALGRTGVLLRANILVAVVELVLLLLALKTGRIELVAVVVLFAYVSQMVVLVPLLRRSLGITVGDLALQLWPVIPAIVVGYGATLLVPASVGGSVVTLAMRGAFTAVVVAFVHGACTRFRCFQEASGIVGEHFARARAEQEEKTGLPEAHA
jgi:O-antigen/teichoic acid export membrane protein